VDFDSSGYILKSDKDGSCGNSVFNVFEETPYNTTHACQHNGSFFLACILSNIFALVLLMNTVLNEVKMEF
jgi:hypothetical protein